MRPSFSLLMFIVVLFLPWPGSQQLFLRSVENTVRDLHRNAVTAIVNFGRFQSDLNNPQTGEQVLPGKVREVLTMLRGQGVKRYRLSDSIAADNWVFQQIIASAWPRKLEADANARLVLNSDPMLSGCLLMERQREVSLVYCP